MGLEKMRSDREEPEKLTLSPLEARFLLVVLLDPHCCTSYENVATGETARREDLVERLTPIATSDESAPGIERRRW
jgi:hypothetical protein